MKDPEYVYVRKRESGAGTAFVPDLTVAAAVVGEARAVAAARPLP